MKCTETETLLASVDLTLDDVYAILKEGLAVRYKSFGHLREFTTVDDMTQDALVYCLSPMKSTNEIRLNHYIKSTNNRAHIINIIKQTAYQLPLWQLRGKEAKRKILSLDESIYNDPWADTFRDTIIDAKAARNIQENLLTKELVESVTEELNDINLFLLKKKAELKSKIIDSNHLPFLLDTRNYLNACKNTKRQLEIIQDLFIGYTKGELSKKYDTFKEDLEIIKTAFLGKINVELKQHTYACNQGTIY